MNTTLLNSIALVCDIVGAILIFIGSERLTGIISKMGYKVAERMGKFDSAMEPGIFKE